MVESPAREMQSEKCGLYENYSSKEASNYGIVPTVRKWKKIYPNLHESTVRGFKNHCGTQETSRKNKSLKKVIVNKF